MDADTVKVRPAASQFSEPEDFFRALLAYRKSTEKSFSVLQASRRLRRVSPALVSLILAKKRRITADRADELALLCKMTAAEKFYFKNWILQGELPQDLEGGSPLFADNKRKQTQSVREVSPDILSDWLNVYVKDCFHLQKIQAQPDLIFDYLKPIASRKRIEKSLQFLLREGHLRKTLDGKLVVEVNLTVTDPQKSQPLVRQFHKAALGLAKGALDLFPVTERHANTMLLALDTVGYEDLAHLIREFGQRVQEHAAQERRNPERIFQLIVNLSPTGEKLP